MFGIGFPELIVICIVALVFIGPQKLPELLRQGGKLFVQLRRTANDVKSSFEEVVHEAEEELRRTEAEALRQAILAEHVKAPKLIESASASHSDGHHGDQTDGHHDVDPHHFDHPHHPDQPEGALPFQPHLLGAPQTPAPQVSLAESSVPDTSSSSHDAPTKGKDSTST
jgi:Tat protein translocase TatB subunit